MKKSRNRVEENIMEAWFWYHVRRLSRIIYIYIYIWDPLIELHYKRKINSKF